MLVAAMMSLSEALTAQEALSGVFGSISLATWIFLLVSWTWHHSEGGLEL